MPNRKLEDWFDSYVYYCHDSEPPTKYHEWCAVSAIASALQRKCKLVWGSLTHFPNFYIAITGPAGEARKGTAMNFAREFVDELNIPLAADANSPQALIRRLMESEDTEIGGDDNYISTHSSLTCFSPELTVFLGYQNKEFMSILCDFYDCRQKFIYETIGRGTEEIIGVYLNLIGATTPDLIQMAMPVEIVGSGLASRIIFVFEESIIGKVPCPFFTQTEQGKELKMDLIHDLHQIKALSGQFKVSQRFMAEWIDFYTKMPTSPPFDPKRFSHYWSRRPGHVIKLSMIFSASRSNEMVIRIKDLERAKKLLSETEKKMPKVFAGMGKSAKSDIINAIMRWIALKEEVSHRDLMTEFVRDVESFEMDRIIKTLRDMRFISVTETSAGMRIRHIKPSEGGPETVL
jgi:hypothetical protein